MNFFLLCSLIVHKSEVLDKSAILGDFGHTEENLPVSLTKLFDVMSYIKKDIASVVTCSLGDLLVALRVSIKEIKQEEGEDLFCNFDGEGKRCYVSQLMLEKLMWHSVKKKNPQASQGSSPEITQSITDTGNMASVAVLLMVNDNVLSRLVQGWEAHCNSQVSSDQPAQKRLKAATVCHSGV